MKKLLCALALIASYTGPAAAHDDKSKVTLVYEHPLPNVPGKSIKGVLVEYPPGGSSDAHTHPSSAFIYATVLEGAIKSQVNDGPVTTYRAGQNFSEESGRPPWRQRKRQHDGAREAARRVRRQHRRERPGLALPQVNFRPHSSTSFV